ncbi:helix-turn-helix transcriptional regulator [Cytobacillus praedii]|uniref:XRE family transcriptional regulator n=1 Tax=Cytobacillus praedii TaxID=1742358 RepID=A0A4V2NTR8_9BACI|nr:helix-turn-helix transcriptional regulator [Cytobacillus praedii]TCJ01337.1 XRE family transcriptional regulator [Cytobacillus praedii]
METRNWLLQKRTAAKMTQEEVAVQAEIQRPYYTQIESGVRNPSVKVAKKIASILNFEWILFFESNCSDKRHSRSVNSA